MVCTECIRNSLLNPVSIFDITSILLSVCTNLTGHSAMVTNLSRPGAIRIMSKTCLCVTGFYLGYTPKSSFCKKRFSTLISLYSINDGCGDKRFEKRKQYLQLLVLRSLSLSLFIYQALH